MSIGITEAPVRPLYFRSLYALLDKCTNNITCSVGCCDVVTYADTSFLQIFLWERFSKIAPRPIEFKEVTFKEVMIQGELKRKDRHLNMPTA